MTLRDELGDAIVRGFCTPLRIADGEDPVVVRGLAIAALVTNPDAMRRVMLIHQEAAQVLANWGLEAPDEVDDPEVDDMLNGHGQVSAEECFGAPLEPLGRCFIHGDYWTEDCRECGR